MNNIGSYEAKTHLPRLLKRVEQGEKFVITKHGIPVALLAPIRSTGHAEMPALAVQIKQERKGRKLGNVSIRQLIIEGRKY